MIALLSLNRIEITSMSFFASAGENSKKSRAWLSSRKEILLSGKPPV
jgi:hypothetical protein